MPPIEGHVQLCLPGVCCQKLSKSSSLPTLYNTKRCAGLTVLSASAAECRACHIRMARYHCSICQLFDDEPGRDIYHCPFCNLCRLGKGLGRDVRHCMQCNCCMDLAEFKQHKCRDLSTCPVCTEYLFDSNSPYRVSVQHVGVSPLPPGVFEGTTRS